MQANIRLGIAVETGQGLSKRVHEVSSSDYDKLYAVNERGVWLCCKYALGQVGLLVSHRLAQRSNICADVRAGTQGGECQRRANSRLGCQRR